MEIQKFYKNFRKKVVKSTIFELEQSFKHIFGVAENFWFNGGVKKGGASRRACWSSFNEEDTLTVNPTRSR